MRNDRFKQVACVSAPDAATFETQSNAILAGINDPEIIFDKTRPFTAYIVYRVRKDVPETVLELLELLDDDGGHATCANCPHLQRSEDKRKKWHTCRLTGERTREDSRACEHYYVAKRQTQREALQQYQNLPYTIE